MNSDSTDPANSTINPYWTAVKVSGFIFVGTTLALVMVPFAEQRSPVNQFLRNHGDWLAALEVGVVLGCGVMAMATDQRQTREASEAVRRQQPKGRESSDVG